MTMIKRAIPKEPEVEKPPEEPVFEQHQGIPGMFQGMFVEYYEFSPLDEINVKEIAAILKAMKIRFGGEVFVDIPEPVRKHFVVINRDTPPAGNPARYTKKRRQS